MRILVCFKVTPDYEALREADWTAGAAKGIDARFVRRVLNCFDEAALELALRLSDRLLADRGTAADLGALCVGGREAEPYLKTLLALGHERAVRVDTGADLDFAPAATAALVAAYVRRIERTDLLLFGCRSGPGDGGTVPFRVAEALGWPCLTEVTEIEPAESDRLRVTCTTDEGPVRLTVRPPCALAIGNAVVARLRVPTLTDRLARKDRRVRTVTGDELGVDVAAEMSREPCAPEGLEVVDRRRSGVVVAGDTPREKARLLYDAWLESRIDRR